MESHAFVGEEGLVELPLPAAPAATTVRRRSVWHRLRAASVPYLFLLPAAIGIGVWVYFPLAKTVELSFYDWDLLPTSPKVGVGFDNYSQMLGQRGLWQAVENTALYAAALLLFAVVIPLGVALAVRGVGPRARGIYRAVIFIPFLVAPVATAVLWRWLLAAEGGLVNRGFEALSLGSHDWLREAWPAFVAIVVIVGWKLLGFACLVVFAGLESIDPEYERAAASDGASRWQVIRHVTLPLLTPTLAFMGLITVLVSAQWVFPIVDTLTKGGPGTSTTNIYYLLYQFGFSNFNVGVASAAGVCFFIVFGAVALVGVWLMDRYSFYEE